ncbi:MAG: molybdate ABC transporter substrate-binding protein [Syntrophomonas sp.]|nr:molybdate ABC transporter substrate-binding protein [Syntrophomonas sp.]
MKKFLSLILSAVLLCGLLLTAGCGQQASSPPPEAEKISFSGQTLNLYVAAGMKKPMDVIIKSFQDETGAAVAVNYGPSGGLFAQIEQSQPCDLYYSADWLYIEKLEEAQKIEKSSKFLKDNIVLVVSETGQSKVTNMDDLAKSGVTVVIADPQAPVGVYAKNSIENLGLWEKVSPNIKAMPSTVNQVAIMIKEDQLDAGLIYSSVANGNKLKIAEVIDEKYSGEIVFGTAIIKGGQKDLAAAFADHAVKNIAEFEKYGWKAYE